MPVFTINDPDGNEFEISAPEGATQEQAFQVFTEGFKAGAIKPTKQKEKSLFKESVKQNLASAAGNFIAGVSHPAAGLAGLFSKEYQDKIFKNKDDAQEALAKWGGNTEMPFGMKAAGMLATLPASVLGMLVSPIEAGDKAIKAGEDSTTALKAMGIDTLGTAAGILLPFPGASKLARAATGGGINAAQDYATKAAEQALMKTEEGRAAFEPTLEGAALAAIPGAAFGALSGKKKPAPAHATIKLPEDTQTATPALEYSIHDQPPKPSDNWQAAKAMQEAKARAEAAARQTTIRDLSPEVVEAQRNLNALSQAEGQTTPQRRVEDTNRGDLTQQQALPFENDPVPGMAKRNIEASDQLDLFEHKQPDVPDLRQQQMDDMFNSRPQTDENLAARQAQEVQKQQELDFQTQLEQKLREGAYTPTGDGQGPKTRAFLGARSQRGAIHPQVFEDLYNFGKSVVRTADGLLRPLYHGTGQVFDNIRGSKEGGALGNGVYLAVRPEYASGYAEGKAPNVHQVYADIKNPLEIRGAGDPMVNALIALGKTREQANKIVEKAYDEKGYITNEVRNLATKAGYDGIFQYRGEQLSEIVAFKDTQVKNAISGDRVNKFGQGGSAPMLDDFAEGVVKVGEKLVNAVKGVKARTLPKDSLDAPQTPEMAQKRADLRAKAKAINSSAYQQIMSTEDALASLGKPLSGAYQQASGGLNAVSRRNPTNGALKFALFKRTMANEASNSFLRKYMTSKDGYGELYSKLSDQDAIDANAIRQWANENQTNLTTQMLTEMGANEKVSTFLLKAQEVNQALDAKRLATNEAKGLESAPTRAGYFRSMFDRNFVAFAGKTKKGEFALDTVINAKSRKEFTDALKLYKQQGMEIVMLGKGGRTPGHLDSGHKKQWDEVGFFLNALAEDNPKFAKFKDELKAVQDERNKQVGQADKRDLVKKGVKGYKGNKPWQDAATNAKEALEAEIRHVEELAKSYHYQDFLDATHDMMNKLPEEHATTKEYLGKYLANIKGETPQGSATAINLGIDEITRMIGWSASKLGVKVNENPRELIQGLNTALSASMLGTWNMAMGLAQTLQILQAAPPEALRIRSEYGLNPATTMAKFFTAGAARSWLAHVDAMGKLEESGFPQHLKEAYRHMKEVGMEDLSEALATTEILDSKLLRGAKQVAFAPMTVPEKVTRPVVYLWFTDLLHEAGFTGDNLRAAAKQATDAAMVDYHNDEAPLMYNHLGILKDQAMALRKYTHNALDTWELRTQEVARHPAAFLSAVGLSTAFGGLVGLPLYHEYDEWVTKPLTGKSGREHLEDALGKDSSFVDGAASVYTGYDIASRMGMSEIAPDSIATAIAGARLSKLSKIIDTGLAAVKEGDTQSLVNFGAELVPSGLRQAYNQEFNSNEQGQVLNTKGQPKYDFPRTEDQQRVSGITGMKPIEERREDQRIWASKQRMKDIMDKQKKASALMQRALARGDSDALAESIQDFLDAEGNPANISNKMLQSAVENIKSERQRQTGKTFNTPMGAKRVEEFNQ